MACPGGCTNGGGQIRPEGLVTPKELLSKVNEKYDLQELRYPHHNLEVKKVYELFFGDESTRLRDLHTQYHTVPKLEILNPHTTQW